MTFVLVGIGVLLACIVNCRELKRMRKRQKRMISRLNNL